MKYAPARVLLSVVCLFSLASPGVVTAKTLLVANHAPPRVEKLAPIAQSGVPAYDRGANEFASAIVVDVESGEVLYEYKPDIPWPAASITKLMGALVFLDHAPQWGKVVSMSSADEVGGGRLRVAHGATLSIQDLFYSSITASANNAATAMARVAGMSVPGFVEAMNKKAVKLGLQRTRFADPSGMDPQNFTTARDISVFAGLAYDTYWIRRSATTASYSFRIRNTKELKTIKNTNDLLVAPRYDDVYVTGGKTGFLYESMYNLAVRMRPIGAKGNDRHVMVVVLGSPTRAGSFESAKELAEWAWKAYSWE